MERRNETPRRADLSSRASKTARRKAEAARKKLGETVEKGKTSASKLGAEAGHISKTLRDSAIASTAKRRAETAQQRLDETVEKGKTSALKVGAQAGHITETLRDSTMAAAKLIQSTPVQLRNRVFRECSVPVLLLPTGSHAGDFYCIFDFDNVMEELRSRALPRPILEVWTGRKDFDQQRFAEYLKDEFIRQFTRTKEETLQTYQPDIEDMESKKKEASGKLGNPLTLAIAAGTVSAVLLSTAGTLLGLFMFTLALFGASRFFHLLADYLNRSGQMSARKKEMEGHLKELDREFDSKTKVFQRAVKNLEFKVHPQIQPLVKLFCEVDGVLFCPDDLENSAAKAPEIKKYLQLPEYVGRIPPEYRPLLDVV